MLTGRTLAIVCAADDNAAAFFLTTCREFRIDINKAIIGVVRNVAAIRQQLCPCRENVVCRDVVFGFKDDFSRIIVLKLLAQREGLDIWTTAYLNGGRVLSRLNNQIVVDVKALRHFNHWSLAQRARVRQHTS